MSRSKPLRELFGAAFVEIFVNIKNAEHAAQMKRLSPWEVEHLVSNV